MAPVLRALREGLRGGSARLAAAVYLYVAALAFAWLAAAPFAAALHGALDGQPGADRMTAGGGLEVLEEMSRSGATLWPAGLGGVGPLALAFVPLALVLAGGTYGLASGTPAWPWTAFWTEGARRFPEFLGFAILAAVYAAATGAVAWGAIAGISAAFREPSGPAAYWTGIGLVVVVAAFAVLHARTVLGFAFARPGAGTGGRLLPGFALAVSFCWRHLPATHGIGALFLALQASSALLGLAAGRVAGQGGWCSAVLAQAGWLGVAWLRAAEVRARVAYAFPASGAVVHREETDGESDTLSRGTEGPTCDP
ncbi:MAG: hypothetical protein LAO51_02970 [Acidobacteriia bacterium]|nr:hypothetical protein [Terriglobia bacterium]